MNFKKTFYEGLPPDIIKRAELELGETEEVKNQSLSKLKQLIEEEPDFHPITDDNFLLRFLRTRKFDVEKAFKSLQSYYKYKARYSGIITDLTPNDIKSVLDQGHATALEFREANDYSIALVRPGQYDIHKVSRDEISACLFMCAEVSTQIEVTQVVGYCVIFDLSGYNLRKAAYYASPTMTYRNAVMVQDCLPCRVKAIHFVNEPMYFSVFFSICRRFLSEKLQKRVYFHGSNLQSLHKYIPPEILPEELGGKQGPIANYAKEFISIVHSQEQSFIDRKKYGYQNETLQKLKK